MANAVDTFRELRAKHGAADFPAYVNNLDPLLISEYIHAYPDANTMYACEQAWHALYGAPIDHASRDRPEMRSLLNTEQVLGSATQTAKKYFNRYINWLHSTATAAEETSRSIQK